MSGNWCEVRGVLWDLNLYLLQPLDWGWCNILRPAFFPLGFRLISTNNNDFIEKQRNTLNIHAACI